MKNEPVKSDSLRPYKVYAIKDGVVIDHIPARKAFKVIDVLGLKKDKGDSILTMGVYLESKKMGRKDVLKIEHRELTDDELNKLVLIAPQATINIIKNAKVSGKRGISIPERFKGLIKCPNPVCITNNQPVKTIFMPETKEPLKLKCLFCERVFERDEVELI